MAALIPDKRWAILAYNFFSLKIKILQSCETTSGIVLQTARWKSPIDQTLRRLRNLQKVFEALKLSGLAIKRDSWINWLNKIAKPRSHTSSFWVLPGHNKGNFWKWSQWLIAHTLSATPVLTHTMLTVSTNAPGSKKANFWHQTN